MEPKHDPLLYLLAATAAAPAFLAIYHAGVSNDHGMEK